MYTIGEAAQRAGVTPEVLRAWERRYAVVTPRRTSSGYRLYDEVAIRRLRAMRELLDDGWKASTAAASVRDLPDDQLAIEREAAPERPQADELSRRFVAAAAAIDAAGVEQALDDMSSGASFEAAAERHLFPALHALGDAWAAGRVSVAAEHAASAAVHRRLGEAFDAAGNSRSDARPVLVGLPAGARHELGALAFAVVARRAGLPVRYLGPDLPADDWVRAVETTDAVAAVIAVPGEVDAEAARSVARRLRHRTPNLVVAFGGRGAAAFSGGDSLPAELPAAVDELRRRLASA